MLENTGKINRRLNWIESIKRRACLELLFFSDYLHCGSRGVPDSPPTHPPTARQITTYLIRIVNLPSDSHPR